MVQQPPRGRGIRRHWRSSRLARPRARMWGLSSGAESLPPQLSAMEGEGEGEGEGAASGAGASFSLQHENIAIVCCI